MNLVCILYVVLVICSKYHRGDEKKIYKYTHVFYSSKNNIKNKNYKTVDITIYTINGIIV